LALEIADGHENGGEQMHLSAVTKRLVFRCSGRVEILANKRAIDISLRKIKLSIFSERIQTRGAVMTGREISTATVNSIVKRPQMETLPALLDSTLDRGYQAILAIGYGLFRMVYVTGCSSQDQPQVP
jgi:hypothetical protein